jgi:RNA polymerase sigma-70 factor, ECF subfamily
MTARAGDVHDTVETIWRLESAKIIAVLARIVNDVGLAEELASDAALAALEQWPESGVPDRPAAWLMVTAKRRAIDRIRREQNLRSKYARLAVELESSLRGDGGIAEAEAELDDDIGDEQLRVIFTACHPLLSVEARTALTLKFAAGLTTPEIARAYLSSETTIAQRVVRAKKRLAKANVTFDAVAADDVRERLSDVLEVVYLLFNEGYTATAGADLMRPQLCEDAQRLAQRLAALVSDQPEVHGLAALLDFQASRQRSRLDADGDLVPLPDQDRGRWDRLLIRRGLTSLDRARRLTADPGPYHLQAAIAACHARASRAEDTDWLRIAALYTRLLQVQPSPVAALNRAVAFGEAFGPESGLRLLDELAAFPAMQDYHLVAVVRGDLLSRLGRHREAGAEFRRAAAATENERERRLLLARADEVTATTE